MQESSPSLTPANFTKVDPVKPVAPYIGGKRNLSGRLCKLIDATPHHTYAEVMVGMGGIFFRRKMRPRAEVINDWSEEVHKLFRVLQVHYVAFLEMMRFQVTSRAEFERLAATDPATLTDMQRAARFLYLQRTTFGGKVAGQNFGVSPINPARFDITKLQPMLEAVHERLASVVIERKPWSDFVRAYDREGTLFYLDPPYYGCERDYGDGMFDRSEFALMAEQLRGIKGKFILSINDKPQVREIFAWFTLREEDVRYTIGGNDKAGTFGELIISNF